MSALRISERILYPNGSIILRANSSKEAHTDVIFIENIALNVHRYVEDILHEAPVLYSPFIGDKLLLMRDIKNSGNQHLDKADIQRIDWSASSQDFNFIETFLRNVGPGLVVIEPMRFAL